MSESNGLTRKSSLYVNTSDTRRFYTIYINRIRFSIFFPPDCTFIYIIVYYRLQNTYFVAFQIQIYKIRTASNTTYFYIRIFRRCFFFFSFSIRISIIQYSRILVNNLRKILRKKFFLIKI